MFTSVVFLHLKASAIWAYLTSSGEYANLFKYQKGFNMTYNNIILHIYLKRCMYLSTEKLKVIFVHLR